VRSYSSAMNLSMASMRMSRSVIGAPNADHLLGDLLHVRSPMSIRPA
jgi:hypothetical protein